MTHPRRTAWHMPIRSAAFCAGLVLLATFLGPGVASALPTATITGSFAEGCRDFAALSSKDISHVELHYTDLTVLKDESVDNPTYSIDGADGTELDFVIVKSGTTRQLFECDSATPPVAVLELQVNPICGEVREDPPLMHCSSVYDRTEWTSYDGTIVQLQGDLCVTDPSVCQFTLRGTSSSDPDNDITTWSVDFGDGTFAGGNWTADPPEGLVLTLPGCNRFSDVTLTITDSKGLTGSDRMRVATGNCAD